MDGKSLDWRLIVGRECSAKCTGTANHNTSQRPGVESKKRDRVLQDAHKGLEAMSKVASAVKDGGGANAARMQEVQE